MAGSSVPAADRRVARPPEQALGGRVRIEDQAAGVGSEDGVAESIEHALERDGRGSIPMHRLTTHD